jgi:hypothetical protein
MQLQVARSYAGPPNMGHGGYVAGLVAARLEAEAPDAASAVQVTLRKPVPLDEPLDVVVAGGHVQLRREDEVIVDGERVTSLALDVPAPPSLADAAAAEGGSPSRAAQYNEGRGVHPTCFGCGAQREGGDGLRIFAGPVDVGGVAQVAGPWRPDPDMVDERSGEVGSLWVLAALDCPGAFAFITGGDRAGLLGRIVFERCGPRIDPDADHVVTGWRIGTDGRKMFAGTALHTSDGELLAMAKATWFGFPGR